MTIVSNLASYQAHPFVVLSPNWQTAISERSERYLPKFAWKNLAPVVTLSECFAQICNINLPKRFDVRRAEALFFGLLGAVHSPRFLLDRGQTTIRNYTRVICVLMNACRKEQDLEPLAISLSAGLNDATIAASLEAFERQVLDEEAVWVWSAWRVPNKDGKHIQVPLYSIYKTFGYHPAPTSPHRSTLSPCIRRKTAL